MLEDEDAILAAAMLAVSAHEPLLQLGEQDFTTHANRVTAAVIRDMIRRGDEVSVVTVAGELEARGQLRRSGGSVRLHEMCSALPTATNASYYAHRVRQRTRLRLMQQATEQLRQSLDAEQAIDGIDELVLWRTQQESRIPGPLDSDDIGEHTVTALLAKTFGPKVWLLPGVMLRGDRAVITGGEGVGKAWLMRQIAAAAAAGVHPFTGEPFGDGYRVLMLDCENGEQEMQEGFQRMVRALPGNGWQDRIFAYSRDSGVDLTRTDAGWLHQAAAATSPDLIVVGPAYKIMYGRDPQKDTDVLELLLILDEVRARHNASVIVEHHAPNGSGVGERSTRPYGSSYWRRWATIGVGLAPHDMTEEGWERPTGENDWDRPHYLDVPRWRFMRGAKRWPHALRMGADDELPWLPWQGIKTPDYEPGDAA